MNFIKVERVTFSVAFMVMLGTCIVNIYAYLYKGGMASSYPLVLAYIVLTIFSLLGTVYELFMGFGCGNHDCFTHLLITIMPEYRLQRLEDVHKSYMTTISIFWKLR